MIEKQIAEYLWNLLDDIDTLDDIVKTDGLAFRDMVRDIQKKRWETGIICDGFTLDWTNSKVPIVPRCIDRKDKHGV